MAHTTANGANRLDLPRINVDVSVSDAGSSYSRNNDANTHQPDNYNESENEAVTPIPTPTTLHAHSPSQLSTPAFGRDRSLSGSTAHSSHSDSPLLKPPQSSGGASTRTSSVFDDEERQDALKPDPGSEKDFDVQDNKFAFSPGQLNKLLNPKSLAADQYRFRT
jgi:Ca2+-transporting ATPase